MREVETDALVIGGGISGIVTAKCLMDAGFEVNLVERTGDVGGLWMRFSLHTHVRSALTGLSQGLRLS